MAMLTSSPPLPRWSRAAATAAAVLCLVLAGPTPVAADVGHYSDVGNFTTYADSQHGFPHQTFRSSPIIAPVLQVNSWNQSAADDAPYLFLGTVYGHMRAGPMILDARDLSLVYADQRYDNTYASSAQMLNGSRYLTFWEGVHNRGHAVGHCLVFDESYKLKYNVTARGLRDGALADMHEMHFTPQATIVFSTYFNRPFNCTPVGGPEEALLMDSGFQEVDPETNEVLFEWSAADHFDITDSFVSYGKAFGVGKDSGFDFFHINSIEKTSDGNYLISSRHLSMLTLIDGRSGSPVWILGGKRNQFTDLSGGKATDFGWQHDARFLAGNQSQITMFDNHGQETRRCGGAVCHSRGLHLEIDAVNKTARVVHQYLHPQGINSGAMGGLQTLDSGNVLVGWGYNPGFVEYSSDGKPVMDVQRGKIGEGFLADMFAYRVGKHNWRGRPTWPPSAAVDAPNGTVFNATLYVSWNGATDVASWAVLAHNSALDINNPRNLIAESPRRGFETRISLGTNHTSRYLAAAALAADGSILGSTYVIDMTTGGPVMLASDITSVRPWSLSSAMGSPSYGMAVFGAAAAIALLASVAQLASLSLKRLAPKGRRVRIDRGAYTKICAED